MTREGIPVRSWVLPDNTAGVSTVETVCCDLRAEPRSFYKPTTGVRSRRFEVYGPQAQFVMNYFCYFPSLSNIFIFWQAISGV